jgi:predicted dehydrogenase
MTDSFKHTRPPLNRRTFLQAGVATGLTAAAYRRAFGANERIGVGIIGFGLIGRIHTRNFHAQPDVRVVGVADVYGPRRTEAAALVGDPVLTTPDFRRLLDHREIQAVVVATPDHWHALQTMLACAAGKDVYVEKPLNLFVREGQWMLDVARRHRRVVQLGTQQRSAPHYQEAKRLLQEGRLGKLVSVQCNFFRNLMPGFGRPPDQDPPQELDWDLMLGPAPQRRYNPNRGIYHFRWFWDYSGGQMTNLGQHSLDIVDWIFATPGPTAVASSGGRFFLQDNCETPDVQDVIIEYPGYVSVCQYRECTAGLSETGMGSLVFLGTKGAMTLGRDGYEIVGDKKKDPIDQVARILGGHPAGGPQPAPATGAAALWTEPAEDKSGQAAAQYVAHLRNFLDCIRSRQTPNSDLASAHRVATACHLANISLRTGRKIRWDAQHQQIVGDPEAQALLTRPYRQPWDAELRTLGVS